MAEQTAATVTTCLYCTGAGCVICGQPVPEPGSPILRRRRLVEAAREMVEWLQDVIQHPGLYRDDEFRLYDLREELREIVEPEEEDDVCETCGRPWED